MGSGLTGGDVAVVLFNRNNVTERITAWWEDVGLRADTPMAALELWTREELGTHTHSLQATVAPHACVMVRLYTPRGTAVAAAGSAPAPPGALALGTTPPRKVYVQ